MALGFKSGGRQAGTPNRKTALQLEAAAAGEMPLEFLLRTMRDKRQPLELRVACARHAAPYAHNRLCTVEVRDVRDMHIEVEYVDPKADDPS